jgi:hypothetical protein
MAIKATHEASKALVASTEWDPGRVSVSISLDGRTYPLWFAATGEDFGRQADYLLPLTLFPAMASGARLKLAGEVSPRLLSAVPRIQDIFRLWGDEYWGGRYSGLQRITVDAELSSRPIERSSGVACFFSGGVDSFYTLLKHREEVTHIIFVHGFDISLEEQQELRSQASRMAHAVARELGKTLVEVETNLRVFSDEVVGWGKYHGAALASVALLFQHRFRKVLIAASYTYAELTPFGSHLILDPLWSTEPMEVEHDGCEATRVDKIAYISGDELPMQWLRVCFRNPENAYNCGRCGKCLRARVGLRIVGALERCKTLPHDLSLEEVANMHVANDASRYFLQQSLKVLEHRGTESELARTLAEVLDKNSEVGDAQTVHTERHDLHEQLMRAREELVRTRAKLEASRRAIDRSRAQSKRLAQRNRQLVARYSGRRYALVDSLIGKVHQIPGIGNLVRRKDD